MILFLAEYPDASNIREGMAQRISSIDSHFVDRSRAYLTISFFNRPQKVIVKQGLRTLYTLNFFYHFLILLKLFFGATHVYVHSVHNVPRCSFLFLYLFKRPLTLDIHGVVPEENLYLGSEKLYAFFQSIERRLFNMRNLRIVTVSNAMTNYYREKYPKSNFNSIKYSIFPSHLKDSIEVSNVDNAGPVNIIYAGNLHKWQNVDLMLENIAKIIHHKHYHFYILTGELEKMAKMVEEKMGNPENLEVRSVSPGELKDYYQTAHFGYVLRDDIIVNRVACPTKLIEYMYYGLTPIVLSEDMGDFNSLGFEYIKLDELDKLTARKSKVNIEIIDRIKTENLAKNFQNLFF